jgi:UDP-N-acetylmuramyl pentapeptide phosphotransferase/UDP-N-acetylglucosamine-1-phosphate transferase
VGALIAFATAVVLTPFVRRGARAFGVVDRPGPLKVQREPVPYLGGVAVFVAVALVVAPWHPALLIPLALASALGIADDVRHISPRARLAAQMFIGLVAGIVAPAPVRFGALVTAALVVVLVNAVNLIDGMDALASCVIVVSALGFGILGGDARVLALAVVGALLGFLVFNRPPARIYLGDGGAYLLGTAVALMAACAPDDHPVAWFALPLLVALPLADAGIAIVRRVRAGRSPLAGDRSHVYDQLADRGWSIPQVVAVCVLAQGVATGAGMAVWHVDVVPAAAIVGTTGLLALAVVWKGGFLRTAVAS